MEQITEKNIIKQLIDDKTPFAVCVGLINPTFDNHSYFSSDYFIIIHKSDLEFKTNKEGEFKIGTGYIYTDEHKYLFAKPKGRSNIYEHTMSEFDIDYFKTINDSFIKVQHNEDGRVYELKNNSFKTYVKSIK